MCVCFHQPTCVFRELAMTPEGVYDSSRAKFQIQIPSVSNIGVGFECDSISTLNTKARENAKCVKNRFGKTGKTFSGAFVWHRVCSQIAEMH